MADDAVSHFIQTPLTGAEDVLSQWRERLMKYILRGTAVAGAFVLIASVLTDIQVQNWVNIAVTATAYAVVLGITLIRMPYRVRASILVFLLLALSANSLLSSGVRGEARMFMILAVLLGLMLLGLRAALVLVGLLLAFVSVVAWSVVSQQFTLTEPYDQLSASGWFTPTLTMALTITLLVLGLVLLQREFIAAQKREQSTRNQLLQDREQLELRVSERTRELSLAAEVGRRVSQLRDLDTLLPNAVELIRSQYKLYYAQIYLTDAVGKTLTLRAGTGEVGKELLRRGHRLAVASGSINGIAAGDRKAMIVSDTAASQIFMPNPLLPETRSEMAVPLLVGERVVGVLDLQSQISGALSTDNLPVFQALAGQLAIALDNAALFVQTEQARHEVEAQSRRLTQSGWQEYLNAVERSERIGYMYDQNYLSAFNTPLPETQAENTVKLPIVVTGTPVGAIQLERAGDQPWHGDELELVNSVVEQASRQLENLRLLAQSENYRSEAEAAARRLTRAGWSEYLQNRTEHSGYLYDQTAVQPLDSNLTDTASSGKVVIHPLNVGAETVGELAFDGLETLDEASKDLVSNVANLLSSHIEGLRLSEQTQKALIQTEDLYTSSAQVVRSSTIAEVLTAVIESTSLKRFDRASFVFFNQPWEDQAPESGSVAATWDRTGEEPPAPVGTSNPIRNTAMIQILRRDEPVLIPDVTVDTGVEGQFRSTWLNIGRSLVFYPLVAGDSWFGFLSVAANQPIYMTDEEIRPIQTLVGQAATVMQSIRLLQDAQTRAQREQALRQITSAVRGSTNADTILRTATRELGVVLGRRVKVQLGRASQTSALSNAGQASGEVAGGEAASGGAASASEA
jgi:GAF domain-containing protein